MDTQEAYAKIRRYFTKPGAMLAQGEDGSCFYRRTVGGRVRKCAVGCLIPKAKYSKEIEGRSISSIYSLPAMRELFAEVDGGFLEEVQTLHDAESVDADDFVAHLDELAEDFGLVVVA